MADGPALALQGALVAALSANSAVTALVGARVYDEPPQAVTLPYLRIGDIDVQPFRTDGGAKAWSVIFAIEVHSRPIAGRVEATRIAEAVAVALDEQESALTVAGHVVEWVFHLTQTVGREADGKSYSAAVAFEASLSE